MDARIYSSTSIRHLGTMPEPAGAPSRAFDILLVVPLEEEMSEVLRTFEIEENLSTARQVRYALKSFAEISLLAVLQEDMGYSAAAKACEDAYETYRFNLVISLGIAGGLSKDLALGDVAYTGTLFDVYNNAKVSDSKTGGIAFESAPQSFETDREISAAFSFIRVMPELNQAYFDWSEFQGLLALERCPTLLTGRDGADEALRDPIAREGAIACGLVTNSEGYNTALRSIHRNMLAVETESGAVFRFCNRHNLKALAIRGVSDYANRSKGELEAKSRGAVRAVAAGNACSFLRLQFDNPYFVKAVAELRTPSEDSAEVLEATLPPNPLPALLESLSTDIDEKLRELSPEYRSKPLGYRVPTPRVRQPNHASAQFELPNETEIWEALGSSRSLLIRVPRNFPDRSLAWVIANDLLSREVDGLRLLPLTIAGNSLSPPKSGISKASGVRLKDGAPPGSRYVVIIDNLPVMAASRLKFISDEIIKHPDVWFVVLADEERNPITYAEFATLSQSTKLEISEISFSEITNFLQRHYDMPGTTAEVVAFRLQSVFSDYNMQAHPTFFAGIPAEALVTILDTNARSELIQLAVLGYLSLVVAADIDKVRVNRTTRLAFLRKLVRELNVEKRVFTQSDLVRFADAFSKQFALGFQPIQFVSGFFLGGVLRMEGDYVQFSLPFFEAYVLALELAEDQPTAIAYFDIWSEDFDVAAFDIYSEISANAEIVKNVDEAMAAGVAELKADRPNAIFSSELKAPLLSNKKSVTALEGGLKKTENVVRERKSDLEAKQRYLDVFAHITRSIRMGIEKKLDDGDDIDASGAASTERLLRFMQVWQIAVTLLGSGAERIPASQKASLARNVLAVADCLVDHWMRLPRLSEAERLRGEFISEERLSEMRASVEFGGSDEEFRKSVEIVFDLSVSSLMGMPLSYCLGQLADRARNSALAMTLTGLKGETTLAEMFRAIWLYDIDPSRAKGALDKAIAKAPRAPFFRETLLSYLLFRVYWDIPDEKSRLALIDTGNRLLKPLNRQLPRAEVAKAMRERHAALKASA